MNDGNQRVHRDREGHRVGLVRHGRRDFLILDEPGRIGDVRRSVDKRLDPVAAAAARDGDFHAAVRRHELLRGCLRDRQNRRRPVDHHVSRKRRSSDRERRGKGKNQFHALHSTFLLANLFVLNEVYGGTVTKDRNLRNGCVTAVFGANRVGKHVISVCSGKQHLVSSWHDIFPVPLRYDSIAVRRHTTVAPLDKRGGPV